MKYDWDKLLRRMELFKKNRVLRAIFQTHLCNKKTVEKMNKKQMLEYLIKCYKDKDKKLDAERTIADIMHFGLWYKHKSDLEFNLFKRNLRTLKRDITFFNKFNDVNWTNVNDMFYLFETPIYSRMILEKSGHIKCHHMANYHMVKWLKDKWRRRFKRIPIMDMINDYAFYYHVYMENRMKIFNKYNEDYKKWVKERYNKEAVLFKFNFKVLL